jgi:nucleoside-diphosphate-sugar epimerase
VTICVGITAVGSGIGHAIVQSCKMASEVPYVVGFDANPMAFDTFECDESHVVPATASASHVDELLRLCSERGVHLLIPGLDDDVSVLAGCVERFRGAGIEVLVGGPDFIRLCRDKVAWSRELHPVCPAVVPAWSARQAALMYQARKIALPLVAKPAAGSGSLGVKLVREPHELDALTDREVVQPLVLPAVTDQDGSAVRAAAKRGVILQSAEVSFQMLFSKSGRLLGRMATRNRLKAGIPVEMIPIDDEPYWRALQPAIEHLLARGLRGPVNFQGRVTDDGPRFFEMNGRFTGITAFRAMIGFNEVEAAIADFLDLAPERRHEPFVNRRRIGVRQVIDRVVDLRASSAPQCEVAAPTGRRVARDRLAVAVTGASGWLGRHLVGALIADPDVAEVAALVRDPAAARDLWPDSDRLRIVSVDEALVAELARADLVYHAAFARSPTPENLAASVVFTRRLTSAARQVQLPRLVFISSQAVYGTSRSGSHVETLAPAPETPYAMAKLAGEELMAGLKEASSASLVTSVRLARLYGAAKGLRWVEVPHLFAARAVAEEPLVVRGEHQALDLVHIRDAVAALLRFARPEADRWSPVCNVGGGSPVSLIELARAAVAAARRLGRPAAEIRVERFDGEPRWFGVDISRFSAETGWSPRVSIAQGMDELAALAQAGARPSCMSS